MAFLETLFGSGPKTTRLSRYTAPQQQSLETLLQQSLSGINKLQNKQSPVGPLSSYVTPPNYEGFAPIADLARTQFQSQTIPSIANAFTSLGGSGTKLGSSGFSKSLGSAASGLEQQLAALRSQYGLQQQQLGQEQQRIGLGHQELGLRDQNQQQALLLALLEAALTPQYDIERTPATRGLFGQLGSTALQAAPMILGGMFGGPFGAAAGSSLGSLLGGLGRQIPNHNASYFGDNSGLGALRRGYI